jgi:hypothetical protein
VDLNERRHAARAGHGERNRTELDATRPRPGAVGLTSKLAVQPEAVRIREQTS